ncbi:hypothetical protein BGZ94_001568 [Podila epigama]|nr:hypothetical protein BGZ94_001568 [Podila epigama]
MHNFFQFVHEQLAPRDSTDAIFAKLKKDLDLARNRTSTYGMSVAIMFKGKLVFAEGFGKRNAKDPFKPETVSMIGSLTKAFTATTIGELVAEGKMDWDATPVNTYLPEFETSDPVLTSQLTLEDLLSHRTNYAPLDFSWLYGTEETKELIKRIRYIDVEPRMRAKFNYNNIMYCVAGEAAANVAKVPYKKLVKNKILKPLKMNKSGFTMEEMSKHANHALPYAAATYQDSLEGRYNELPLDGIVEKRAAAGDMYSNALDMARWGQAILGQGILDGKQVLSKANIQATTSAHTIVVPYNPDPSFAPSKLYGLGWILNSYKGHQVYEHGGSISGYLTSMIVFPHDELVVAILTNSDWSGLPSTATFHIADELLGLPKTMDWLNEVAIEFSTAMYGDNEAAEKGIFPDRIPNKPSTHALTDFTGEYFHPGHGTLFVRVEGGKLQAQLSVFKGELLHYHYDTFTSILKYSATKSAALVSFTTGVNGKVSGASLSVLLIDMQFSKKD